MTEDNLDKKLEQALEEQESHLEKQLAEAEAEVERLKIDNTELMFELVNQRAGQSRYKGRELPATIYDFIKSQANRKGKQIEDQLKAEIQLAIEKTNKLRWQTGELPEGTDVLFEFAETAMTIGYRRKSTDEMADIFANPICSTDQVDRWIPLSALTPHIQPSEGEEQ
jgi:hypothetical protein